MIWLLALLACVTPDETGHYGMVGHLKTHGGLPLAGVSVHSMEAKSVTDAAGRFAVSWKEARYAHFTWEDIWFKRSYQPADEGSVVEISLPPLTEQTLACDLPAPCDAELTWQLSDGLIARTTTRCEPGQRVELGMTPARIARVEAVCRTGPGEELPVEVRFDEGDRLRLTPPSTPILVQVVGEDGEELTDCRIAVDGQPLSDNGASPVAYLVRPATLSATCKGRPASPKRVDPATTRQVRLDWSALGPELALHMVAPWAHRLTIRASESWELTLTEDNGNFSLPPLSSGEYIITSPESSVAPEASPPESVDNTLIVVIGETDEGTPTLHGKLVLRQDLVDGDIPVRRVP